MATSTANRTIAAWKNYVKLNVCLQDWKKDTFLTILIYKPRKFYLKIVEERSNYIELQNILDIFCLKAVMHNKLRKFKVTNFGLLSGHRQTYALFKTYENIYNRQNKC
jgi:hypothetical protein